MQQYLWLQRTGCCSASTTPTPSEECCQQCTKLSISNVPQGWLAAGWKVPGVSQQECQGTSWGGGVGDSMPPRLCS